MHNPMLKEQIIVSLPARTLLVSMIPESWAWMKAYVSNLKLIALI